MAPHLPAQVGILPISRSSILVLLRLYALTSLKIDCTVLVCLITLQWL